MIYLVTARELNVEIPLAFVVAAPTRAQAKAITKRYCESSGLQVSSYIYTHDISNGVITRIDQLLLSEPTRKESTQ